MIEKVRLIMKTHQWVYQLLRNNLLCGRIGTGNPVDHTRPRANTAGQSRCPMREALHRLACEGAVEVKNNRRVIVPAMTPEKFRELCDLRILLETHAAEGALPYIKETDIESLRADRRPQRLTRLSSPSDVDNISLHNQAFPPLCLYQANPYQISVPLIESLWLQLGPFSRIAISKLEKVYLVDRHVEALEALRQRNLFGSAARDRGRYSRWNRIHEYRRWESTIISGASPDR